MSLKVTPNTLIGTLALLIGGMMQIRGLPPQAFSTPAYKPAPTRICRIQTAASHASLKEALEFLRREKVYTRTMHLKTTEWRPDFVVDFPEGRKERGGWLLHFDDEDGTWYDLTVNASATHYKDDTCRR